MARSSSTISLLEFLGRVATNWMLPSPQTISSYCRHILFGRKVLHKMGSTFRPSLPIDIGVDVGRAFSVLLFCVAMDPWYYHVNRIPNVIVNKGFMDGLSWPLHVLLFCGGLLILNQTCTFVSVLTLPDGPPVTKVRHANPIASSST